MSLIWIICGAGRGVGKTTVALELCKVLPDSVYAKCGRSGAKVDKPCNFFSNLTELKSFIEAAKSSNKHIVVESNALAKLDYGDIIIFIDGVADKTHTRNDTEQLQTTAHLKICRNATLADWKKVLFAKFNSKSTGNSICDLLITQKRYLFGPGPTVRSKIWFESAGTHVFGIGLARLLENVDRLGTLQKAAKATKVSYRYALKLIHLSEEHFGKTLIERHAGGKHGGNSILTLDGLHMLEVFKKLNKEVAVFADQRFAKLYAKGKN